jgi:hypothetical protein
VPHQQSVVMHVTLLKKKSLRAVQTVIVLTISPGRARLPHGRLQTTDRLERRSTQNFFPLGVHPGKIDTAGFSQGANEATDSEPLP